jgi:hypothetical protein
MDAPDGETRTRSRALELGKGCLYSVRPNR